MFHLSVNKLYAFGKLIFLSFKMMYCFPPNFKYFLRKKTANAKRTTDLRNDSWIAKDSCWFRGTQRICSSHYLFPKGILLAGKNTGVLMSWLGNFVIGRGFAWELLTFSSISTRAGCRNSEDWRRLKKKKKKNPFPLPESSHKHTTAGQSDCACAKKTVLSRFCRFCSVVLDWGIWKRAEFPAGK